MSIDASEVVVGADGRVFVAPEGTAVPTNLSALPAAWLNVGYISEEGVNFTNGAELEDIPAWQSFYPIRKIISARSAGVEFVMRQWNGTTLKLAFGGGTIVDAGGSGVFYQPPAPGDLDVRAMVIEWEDGAENYRLVIPRGIVGGEVESNIVRTSAADLPISFEATPEGLPSTLTNPPTAAELKTQPWYLVTDATSFVT